MQELNPTKSIDDPEIKAWLALGQTKSKKMEVEKKKGHLISLYSIFIIYQSIAIIHLLVSQATVEHKLLN